MILQGILVMAKKKVIYEEEKEVKEGLVAVIYARYSSDNQREESIEGQLRDCYSYAERNGIVVVGEYIDRAMTGTSDARPSFQEMIYDSGDHKFNTVLVWKLDRFSRDRADNVVYKAALKKNGVRVISIMEHIPEGPEGILIESILEGYAEFYSVELSQKLRRGIRESALKKKVLHGRIALGYKKGEDGCYAIEEETAPIVKYIFEEYAAGTPMLDIAEALNAKGYVSRDGKKFTRTSFQHILRNRAYIGEYRYKDIVFEDGIPPLISKELFDQVQKIIDARIVNQKSTKRTAADYFLTGKLYCGHCGRLVTGLSGTSKQGNTHYYYRCAGRDGREKLCGAKNIRKELIERTVEKAVRELIADPEMMDFIIARCVEIIEKDKTLKFRLDALEKKKASVEKSISNLMRAIEQGIITETTKDRMMELEEQKRALSEEIRMIEIKNPRLGEHELRYLMRKFYQDNAGLSCKEVINTFVHHAVLYDDVVVVYFNVLQDDKLMEREIQLNPTTDTISLGSEGVCVMKDMVETSNHHSNPVYFAGYYLIMPVKIAA